MLRLLVLFVAVLGLASLLPSTPNASALPSGTQDQDCLGPLRSALVRSGFSLTLVDVDLHIGRDTTPGDYHGASGIGELAAKFGCQLPVPLLPIPIPDLASGIGDCIDFDDENPCVPGPNPPNTEDTDGDGFPNGLEIAFGSDPNDRLSTPGESALLDEQSGSRTCSDGVDNDHDGRIDKSDASCRLTCDDFGGKDRCSDSDRDGWRQYVEDMYGSDPNNSSSTPESLAVPGTCSDGVDNDLDGKTDADDVGCGGACIDFDNTPGCLPF